ncbi:MAG: peptide-methionine (S)-S-oxide reductase, partial [Deltaproteobacteria bacterium]|nr:peptide-methionine (S)-S-oxide reductase [Deltaproteobacteria bacterium]
TQYRSVVYVSGGEERNTADRLIAILKGKGLSVVTEVEKLERFWPAEDYHQDYYQRTGGQPYCHVRVKRF